MVAGWEGDYFRAGPGSQKRGAHGVAARGPQDAEGNTRCRFGGTVQPALVARWALLAAITIDMRGIRLFDFQKQVWSTWFTAKEEVGSNQWSPDGRSLYFLNRKSRDAPLAWWRIGLGERTPKKIMELPDERILGWWYGLEADGSSSYFTRDLTSKEIYAIRLSYK